MLHADNLRLLYMHLFIKPCNHFFATFVLISFHGFFAALLFIFTKFLQQCCIVCIAYFLYIWISFVLLLEFQVQLQHLRVGRKHHLLVFKVYHTPFQNYFGAICTLFVIVYEHYGTFFGLVAYIVVALDEVVMFVSRWSRGDELLARE